MPNSSPAPGPAAAAVAVPLHATQAGIWLADQIAVIDNGYVVAHCTELRGAVDLPLLVQAIQRGLAETDTPHARFAETESGLVQWLPQALDPAQVAVELVDLRGAADPSAALQAFLQQDLARPLRAGGAESLLRHCLLRLGDEHLAWYQRYHHLCVDGYSFSAIARRIAAIYTALRQGRAPATARWLPFGRVIEEAQQHAQSPAAARDQAFWRDYAAQLAAPCSLSTRDLAAAQTFANVDVLRARTSVAPAPVAALAASAGSNGSALEMVMAALFVYVQRLGGVEAVVAGIPFMRRLGSVAMDATGPVVNVLPLQLRVDLDAGLLQAAQRLNRELARVRRHQRQDAEALQRELGLVGARRALYGPTINLKLYEQPLDFDGVTAATQVLAAGPVEDLEFALWQQDAAIVIELSANPARYAAAEIALHAARLGEFVARLAADPQRPVGAVELLGEAERNDLAQWSQGLPLPPAAEASVLDVLHRQAAGRPAATALVCAGERMDFAALWHRVGAIAAALGAAGVRRGDVVALAVPRGSDSVCGLFGILAAGAIHLPLDLDYPDERLALICADAQPRLLLTHQAQAARLPALAALCLDTLDVAAAASFDWPALQADTPAYLIYTSGTTGTPKGVLATHGSLLNLLRSHAAGAFGALRAAAQGRPLRAAHTTSFAFDASWELLFWLLLGGELHICDDAQRRDAEALLNLVREQRLDALDLPPALLGALVDAGLFDAAAHVPGLILTGSDAVPAALWQTLRRQPATRVYNCYGPTEYTVDALSAALADSAQPVIGRPVANTRVYVLDARLRPVPTGVAGELYIAGDGLALGYLGKPALTAARFVADPFTPGGRMYRSGDRVRWRSDGQLEFLGRVDRQLKLRGFRVEPGEIEQSLAALPGVADAVVRADGDGAAQRLVAYCTPQAGAALDGIALRRQLAAQLPDHLVPAGVLVLPQWPLTGNGKIDHRALPPLPVREDAPRRAAANEAERLVCAGIATVLGLAAVGATDDFFALGGDSISAMGLGTQLRRSGYRLTPRDIFAQRTPARMAAALQPLREQRASAAPEDGALGALPMLRWFAQHFGLQARYSQGVLLRIPPQLDEAALAQGLHAVQRAHPLLRTRAENGQLVIGPATSPPLRCVAVPPSDSAAFVAAADEEFRAASGRLAPAAGQMLQAVRLAAADGSAWLILAVHHLAVDGVSWRVLLPELGAACAAAQAGTALFIAAEETPLTAWAATLQGEVPLRRAELASWRRTLQDAPAPAALAPLLRERDTHGTAQHRRQRISAALTAAVLWRLGEAFSCTVEEILLCAAGRACARLWQSLRLGVMLESHGRDSRDPNVDLSRSVGWLTAEYPVLLDFAAVEDDADDGIQALRAVKRALRGIPERGLGYGVLRHLDAQSGPELAALEAARRPPLLFNYLGRFTQDEGYWTPQAAGGCFADAFAVDLEPALPLLHALELNIFVDESTPAPALALNWSWAPALLGAAQIDALAAAVEGQLQQLVDTAARLPRAADTLVAAETLRGDGARLGEIQLAALRARHGALAAVLPVLPLQQGLLFHAQLGQAASKYNSISRIDFEGPIDTARLRAALDAVLLRQPQLTARFDLEADAQPLQLLPPSGAERWPWSEIALADGDADAQEPALRRIELAELERDFAIGAADRGPLLHAVLVRRDATRSCLFVTAHHLVVDGWSTPLLLRDLLDAYAHGQLTPLRVPYADVVRALAARDLQPAREAWQQALAGVKPTLLYGGETAAPQVHELEITLPAALEQALTARARERGLTLNTLMQGAWGALLAVSTGRDDVVFGAPVSGRFSAIDGIAEHIGLFSNTLPVRLKLEPRRSLLDQLEGLQAQQIALLEHDGLGLAEIQRAAGAGNLFDTLLVSENYPDDAALYRRDYAGARVRGLRNRGYTHYPLTVLVLPGESLRLMVEYRDVVREPQRIMARLLQLLDHLASGADLPWGAYDARLPDEIALIDSVNATAQPLPATTLCALIAAQAQRTPAAIALQDADTALSYAQMQQQVMSLGQRLRAAGVAAGDVVAVALPRSVQLSLALGAVLQAGAAYLPLDTGYPDERLGYMVADARPRLIVTSSALAPRFAAFGEVLLFDALDGQAARAPPLPQTAPTPQHAAYLLYTSGSTGRPKGVLVSHEAIVNRLLWMQHEYGLGMDDTVLQKTPCSFDVSVWEFFWPLLVGARLYLAPPEAHRDPAQLQQLIAAEGVTTLHFVPSMLAAFLAHGVDAADEGPHCRCLRRVFCSGEALPRELAAAWAQRHAAPLHNLYGPTEAAVDVTYKPAADDDAGTRLAASVPIGRPVWNTQLRILDAQLRPVPPGVPGELYLCGIQLAQGYLGRPELTAARFVADPQGQGARMYRTGDVARWLPTGDVEYLGRSDDQLKIRGQRIELGEIESALAAQPGVERAVVHARVLGSAAAQAGVDARQLVAYVSLRADAAFDAAALRAALAAQLPAQLVPVAVVQVDAFPLSANGKLDRKALPDPTAWQAAARAPRPGLESRIANAFARVLGRAVVQADDDFFALGGHSLLALRLAAELRRELQQPVALGLIMGAPSVARLAALLSDAAAASDPANAGFGEVLHLRSGTGLPLFCVHPASGFAWQYAGLARHLPAGLALIGLQSPRPQGVIAASADMDAVCEQHLATLRRLQPQGPYRLLGYSLGGTIAQGLAARLRAAGEEVAFLGLLDTYPPEGQDWTPPGADEAQSEVAREQAQFLAATEEDEDLFAQREKAALFGDIVANYADAVRLLSQARTQRLAGGAVLFVATRTLPPGWDVRGSWAPYLDGLAVHEFDCAHEDILDPANLEALGPLLARLLEARD